MKTIASLSFAVCIALGLPAQAATGSATPSAPERSQRAASGPDARNNDPEGEDLAKSAPSGIGKADRAFVTKAAGAGLYAVEVSKLAATRASDPRIKALADTVIRDQRRARDELQRISRDHNYPLPEKLPEDRQPFVDRIAAMSGPAFDSTYRLQVGIEDHRQDIKLFERARRATQTPDLKAWIDRTLPGLQAQLKQALAIQAR